MLALLLYFGWRDPRVMVTIGGYAQGVTLPIITGAALYLRYFRTDKRLAPSWLSDALLWLAFVLITGFALYSVVTDVVPTVRGWSVPKPPAETQRDQLKAAPRLPR
jgi:hypothetical protein